MSTSLEARITNVELKSKRLGVKPGTKLLLGIGLLRPNPNKPPCLRLELFRTAPEQATPELFAVFSTFLSHESAKQNGFSLVGGVYFGGDSTYPCESLEAEFAAQLARNARLELNDAQPGYHSWKLTLGKFEATTNKLDNRTPYLVRR
jgi:hypothetical protein